MSTRTIASISNAAQQLQPVRQPQPTDAIKASDEAGKAKRAQLQQSLRPQPFRPVTNTQGQVTGQLLNDTA